MSTINAAVNAALNAAHVLLTEDHHLVEALAASRRGRTWARLEYDRDRVEVSAHLDSVEMEAVKASNLCADAGLTALADWCEKIANRISLAKREGDRDRIAEDELKVLTCQGRQALAEADTVPV